MWVMLLALLFVLTRAVPNTLPAQHPLPARDAIQSAQQSPATNDKLAIVGPQPITGSRLALHNPVSSGDGTISAVKKDAQQATAPDAPSVAVPGVAFQNRHSQNSKHASQLSVTNAAAQEAVFARHTAVVAAALGPHACDAGGACAALGEAVESAAEGPECRALHITGKCSAKCLKALKEALSHKLWDACATRCEIDVVSGAALRWAELCESRQPTLLDASKEALQIVATAPGAGRVAQAIIVFAIFVAIVLFAHRRGLLHGTALRLQKRMKRRSSERNLV